MGMINDIQELERELRELADKYTDKGYLCELTYNLELNKSNVNKKEDKNEL